MIISSGRSLHRSRFFPILLYFLFLPAGCSKQNPALGPDRPRLTSKVKMQDVSFYSNSLNRNMQYRVIMPSSIAASQKLVTVYLLHGGGGNFRDWSNYSDVARHAEDGLVLVMPEGESSYYTNSVDRPEDRYEDYIVDDLIADVESRLPVKTGHQNRAIVCVSMGRFGAVKLALKHPELFAFVGGLSSAIDVPGRPFSLKRIGQWRFHKSIFGPWQSPTRRENDPFVLVQSADPAKTPYLFLACGEQEGLLSANKKFAVLLEQHHFQFEFHTTPGGHDWNQWNRWLPEAFKSLMDHISTRH